MSEDFGKWLEKNKFRRENGIWMWEKYPSTGNYVSVRVLGEKIAGMSRAEMAMMRTYFRKQVVK